MSSPSCEITFSFQPDRGAKRPRDEDGHEESRSKQKTAGRDAGRVLVRSEPDREEQTGGDGEKILERLMDQDGEDPEVRRKHSHVGLFYLQQGG